jgi:hypothetical protein
VFKGISIHDAWGSYFLYACEHALCLVHLLRELVFQAEEQGAVWAADLKELLLSMKQATQQAREQGKRWLDPLEVLDWEIAFLRLLDEGDQVTPRAMAPPGTKGRIKQSAARNLLDRLRKHQKAVFCFLEDLRVDFDNDVIAYCTPSAWLASLLNLTFILVMRVLAGRWEQHDPTAINMVHGNAPSSPPIPDRLWRHSIGLSGFSGG